MAQDRKRKQSQQSLNMQGKNPSEPGQGGGQGDKRTKSSNSQDWKNEPGNQS